MLQDDYFYELSKLKLLEICEITVNSFEELLLNTKDKIAWETLKSKVTNREKHFIIKL